MILGFVKQIKNKPTNFAQKILDERKIHTMRKDTGHRWRVGMMAQLAYYNAGMEYNLIKEAPITSIQKVEIINVPGEVRTVKIDGRRIGIVELVILAANDGFDNMDEFWNYFDKSATYRLLHWTNFIYDGNPHEITMRSDYFNQLTKKSKQYDNFTQRS